MLKSRVKARRATREGTTAKVNLELILAYPRVVAVEEQEVTGFKVDALAQVKADQLEVGHEKAVRSDAKDLDCTTRWQEV